MDDYILRKDALEALKIARGYCPCAYSDIAALPAADVTPVKRGKWDDGLDGITPYCFVCGRTHGCVIRCPSYCPNCGAKMDGGGKG